MAFKQSEYTKEFIRANYDRVEILIPKGKKQLLKQAAIEWDIRDNQGKISVSQMIIRALQRQYGIDLSKPEKDD